ncbi:MAG: hypothetical protein P0119_08475 [Nitrospira sp.]|nr:hypothetical protein [Nitrospira sp.]
MTNPQRSITLEPSTVSAEEKRLLQAMGRRSNISWAALSLTAWLVSGCISPVWGQEQPMAQEKADAKTTPEERSALDELHSTLETDQGGPPRDPRFLPPRLRPRLLSEEESAEAERLKRLAAKFGIDPTAIVGRVQMTAQYQNLQQGAHATDAVFRVDLPFRENWLLRMELPYLKWVDPNSPGAANLRGLSDMVVGAGWRVYNTPEYAVFLGAISTFPTAAETDLGFGKYNVGPVLATARFLPDWNSLLFGTLQHLTTVGGDPARKDVSLTKYTLQLDTLLIERWWTIVQGVWQVDWERGAKTSMTLEFEVGRNVIGRWGAFVRPGVGIWGRDVLGAYDWQVEAGVRYVFPSF